MLIRNAEVWQTGLADVRIADTVVAAIGRLEASPGEAMIDAQGGALLPGLHDHHIHMAALAARQASVGCGPPDVATPQQLAVALRLPGSGWLRGVGYHESVMGLPDAAALDALVTDRPVRIQHRSGRMWLLNSQALELVLAKAAPPRGLERDGGRFTGRLFDEDEWLRGALGGQWPDLSGVSAQLARCGVTGLTDMTPRNDPAIAAQFERQRLEGTLMQSLWLAGSLALAHAAARSWSIGPAKLHLHEAALPPFDEACAFVAAAHGQGRGVAVHCTTEVEMVFALTAMEETGAARRDRIEHASIASPGDIARIAAAGIALCVQPHFVAERGDRYLRDVEQRHLPDLYRLRTLADAGIALAGGSDAPFVSADPWQAMRAAVDRTTRAGAVIGPAEALDADAALTLFLASPDDLARERRVAVGATADLCLLDRPWRSARERLTSDDVRMTIAAGTIIHHRID